jgi:receptor expression-enhancing protein 5/6
LSLSFSLTLAHYPPTTNLYTDRFKEVEDKTGYPKAYFFVGIAFLSSALLSILGGAKLMVDLLGFVYPAYMSFKSMDSGSKDDTQWLTYWVVFSFLSIIEGVFGFVVALIPFYFWIKIGIIVWMYYPATRGAQTVYEQALRPLFLPYLDIDKPTKKTE